MGKTKKIVEETKIEEVEENTDFSKDLIKNINSSLGEREVYNFSSPDEDANIKGWISTGSKQLDYIISNKRNGGIPQSRITEIFGPPSIGKSMLSYQLIKSVQKMGGIGILIDTEYAVLPSYLEDIGINTKHNFVFSQQKCIEKIFNLIDMVITHTANKNKDIPILIALDSVAASASKAELEADLEKSIIGESARAYSRGLKKIVEVIGKYNVSLVLLNQTRTKIGVMYGDPEESCSGNAIKYYSSVRVKLSGGSAIYENEAKKDNIIGNKVIATTIKNKVSPPKRKCEFDILFGQGLEENEYIFDAMRQKGVARLDNKKIILEGGGSWKYFKVIDESTGELLVDETFYKVDFTNKILNKPEYKQYVDALMDETFIKTNNKDKEEE